LIAERRSFFSFGCNSAGSERTQHRRNGADFAGLFPAYAGSLAAETAADLTDFPQAAIHIWCATRRQPERLDGSWEVCRRITLKISRFSGRNVYELINFFGRLFPSLFPKLCAFACTSMHFRLQKTVRNFRRKITE
jgi:hypothetical protein